MSRLNTAIKRRPRSRLSVGEHQSRPTFDDLTAQATEAAKQQGVAGGRSSTGIMDTSNGPPAWQSYEN
ncbi:MAG: hypothetical protein ACLQJR_09145 [Stellaceae bacterium]